MRQTDVTAGTSDAVEHVRDVRQRLYARYGHGAITRAAEDIGVARERVSNILSKGAQEILAELDALASEERQ
jgi:hypothetical protein